jgi:dimethylhistidine N-methyltransferase
MTGPIRSAVAEDSKESSNTNDLEEILEGLNRDPKKISPKFFYDEKGSKLFEAICELPEYYPTRTEIAIMREHVGEMGEAIGPRPHVIEFGIGSGLKTKLLLEALDQPVAFAPVDISADHLAETVEALANDFPGIEMLPVAADFTRSFPLPEPSRAADRNLVYFPGSTIGNFEPAAALDLLRVMHHEAGPGGGLLIGLDLKKDRETLERAYNDGAGVTAKFNLNLLLRLNREFGSDFDTDAFHHHAFYNEQEGRIEMHLVSAKDQSVSVAGEEFQIARDEHIVTEYSHKYALDDFRDMAARSGFTVEQVWTDPRQWFSIQYCSRA